MATTVQVSDGTTTISFVDTSGINLLRQNWAPKIATRSFEKRAGVCPYNDVEEVLNVAITGSSTSDLLSQIQDLIALMEKVYEWRENDENDAVTFSYAPNNGSDTSSALIVDLPEDWLTMPNEFEFGVGNIVFLQPVTIKFIRRGLWYTGTTTGTGSAATEPAVATRTWTGAESLHSPVKFAITGLTGVNNAGARVNCKGYFVWAKGDAPLSGGPVIYVYDSASFTASGFSSNTSGINSAGLGGSVYRATASSAATKTLSLTGAMGAKARPEKGRYNILLRLKNNSATTTWTINYEINYDQTDRVLTSRNVILGTDHTDPMILNLGSVYSEHMYDHTSLRINVTPSSATGSGQTMDIDAVCIFELTQNSGAVYLEKINYLNSTHQLWIDPRFVDGLQAQAKEVEITEPYNTSDSMPYRGDLWVTAKGEEALRFCIFAAMPGSWRLRNGNLASSPTVVDYSGNITIWNTTLVPT